MTTDDDEAGKTAGQWAFEAYVDELDRLHDVPKVSDRMHPSYPPNRWRKLDEREQAAWEAGALRTHALFMAWAHVNGEGDGIRSAIATSIELVDLAQAGAWFKGARKGLFRESHHEALDRARGRLGEALFWIGAASGILIDALPRMVEDERVKARGVLRSILGKREPLTHAAIAEVFPVLCSRCFSEVGVRLATPADFDPHGPNAPVRVSVVVDREVEEGDLVKIPLEGPASERPREDPHWRERGQAVDGNDMSKALSDLEVERLARLVDCAHVNRVPLDREAKLREQGFTARCAHCGEPLR